MSAVVTFGISGLEWAKNSVNLGKFAVSAAVTFFVLRLMMDPMSGLNRGYAFITFTTREEALEAVKQVPEP